MALFLDTRGRGVLTIGICARCSRKMSMEELMPDPNYPGLLVCKNDLDIYDPWRLPARKTETITLKQTRPDVSVALNPDGTPVVPDNFEGIENGRFYAEQENALNDESRLSEVLQKRWPRQG